MKPSNILHAISLHQSFSLILKDKILYEATFNILQKISHHNSWALMHQAKQKAMKPLVIMLIPNLILKFKGPCKSQTLFSNVQKIYKNK